MKELRETGGERLIGAHTQNRPYLSIVTTKACKAHIDEDKGT